MKAKIAAKPDLVAEIQTKLKTDEGWDRDTFIRLSEPGLGLKKRGSPMMEVEVASMADLYDPRFQITPFVVLFQGEGGMMDYVVKDFGDFKHKHEGI